jgi:hypothetical protein
MTRALTLRLFLALFAVSFFPVAGQAQVAPYRVSDRQVEDLLDKIEEGSDRFRASLDSALDRSHIDGSRQEDRIENFVEDFEKATDRLRDRFDAKNSAASDVEEVLRKGAAIDDFMTRHALADRAQNDWRFLRGKLDDLARAYNVVWKWPAVVVTQAVLPRADLDTDLIARIRRGEDRFRASIDAAIVTGSDERIAENLRLNLGDLSLATNRLAERSSDTLAAGDIAADMLRKAAVIEAFMRRHPMTAQAQDDWRLLRSDMDALARMYNMSMDWERGTLTITRIR